MTAQLVPACTVSATPLAFGNSIASPIATNIDAESTVNATCYSGANFSVALNRGLGAGATFVNRRLTSGSNTLNYALYRNAARSQVWGDGTGGSNVVTRTGTGTAQALNVYGRIPAGQAAPSGAYTDTVTVTVTF